MSFFSAPMGRSTLGMLAVQTRGLLRLAAIVAFLAVMIRPSPTSAADSGSAADQAGVAPVAAPGASSAIDGGGKARRFDNDDGEDHVDEGDDEFDCDNVNHGEDVCEDDPVDRVDDGDDGHESNDADEADCEDFDVGENRCLDDGQDHVDEGDDEFEVWPEPTFTRMSAASSAAPIDLSAPVALAALIGLGGGGLWLLRRGRD